MNPQTLNPFMARALGLDVQWGVILGDVYPGGPADKAGLQVGDIVLSLNGKPMENARQFEVNLYNKIMDGKVELQIKRGAGSFKKEVQVIERIDPDYRFFEMISTERNLVNRIGALCIDCDADSRQLLPFTPRGQEGVIVAAIAADVMLLGDHWQPGDIIYTLNGRPVKGLRSLKQMVRELEYGSTAVFHVERGGQLRFVTMQVD